MNEVLLVDKPAGWTSFDVVAKIRSVYSKREGKKIKVGHSGTLDPFATGLLIVLLGEATKKQDSYMKQDKEYEATVRLGAVSTTGDPEGEIAESDCDINPSPEDVKEVLDTFVGEISQIPPAHSAIKVNGKRAYQLARAGKEVTIEPRRITIYSLELLSYQYPNLKIRVKCSSGTYIRALGEDIGKSLKCGAYLTELRRTKIGDFDVADAHPIDFFLKV